MTLQQAIDEGRRLAVAVMRDHERLAAEVFLVEDGVVFLDIGWSEPLPSMPRAHHMPGEVTGSGPWKVGDWTIREIDSETDPEYLAEWERSCRYREETRGTRDAGALFASEFLGLNVQS